MFKVSKELVLAFAEAANLKAFNNSYALIVENINESIKTIINRNAFIKSYNIVVANEAFSGNEIDGSCIDLFLCLNAKQIELNFIKKDAFQFKESIATFSKTFKDNFKLFKRKKVSKKKLEKEENKLASTDCYTVVSLCKDLQLQLCKKLYQTTHVALTTYGLTIFGKDEFAQNINIYPVFESDESLVLYNLKNKNQTKIYFDERFINIENMNYKTKSFFKIQARIFNHFFYNIFKTTPNQIFIESLLFNVPLDIYSTNIYETTIGIINYLKNCQIQKLKSICNINTYLFADILNTIKIETALKFINSIKID